MSSIAMIGAVIAALAAGVVLGSFLTARRRLAVEERQRVEAEWAEQAGRRPVRRGLADVASPFGSVPDQPGRRVPAQHQDEDHDPIPHSPGAYDQAHAAVAAEPRPFMPAPAATSPANPFAGVPAAAPQLATADPGLADPAPPALPDPPRLHVPAAPERLPQPQAAFGDRPDLPVTTQVYPTEHAEPAAPAEHEPQFAVAAPAGWPVAEATTWPQPAAQPTHAEPVHHSSPATAVGYADVARPMTDARPGVDVPFTPAQVTPAQVPSSPAAPDPFDRMAAAFEPATFQPATFETAPAPASPTEPDWHPPVPEAAPIEPRAFDLPTSPIRLHTTPYVSEALQVSHADPATAPVQAGSADPYRYVPTVDSRYPAPSGDATAAYAYPEDLAHGSTGHLVHDAAFAAAPAPVEVDGAMRYGHTDAPSGYAERSATQPQYAQPEYAQPQYAQPEYAQPAYVQPEYAHDHPVQPEAAYPGHPYPGTDPATGYAQAAPAGQPVAYDSVAHPVAAHTPRPVPTTPEETREAWRRAFPDSDRHDAGAPTAFGSPVGYDQQQYAEPQYAEPQYVQPQYTQQQYLEQQYAEPQYVEQRYVEQQYAQPQAATLFHTRPAHLGGPAGFGGAGGVDPDAAARLPRRRREDLVPDGDGPVPQPLADLPPGYTDPITGLPLAEAMRADIELRATDFKQFTVVVCHPMIAAIGSDGSVAAFPKVPVAEEQIRIFAEVLRESLRQRDIVGRYDERLFLLFLARASVSEVRIPMDRIRTNLLHAQRGQTNWVDIAFGAAEGTIGQSVDTPLKAAYADLLQRNAGPAWFLRP